MAQVSGEIIGIPQQAGVIIPITPGLLSEQVAANPVSGYGGEASVLSAAADPLAELLTTEERELLWLISFGETMPVIRREVTFCQKSTAARRSQELKSKLGALNMAHAVRIGYEKAILTVSTAHDQIRNPLTPVQAATLKLVSFGLTSAMVAARRGVKQITVKNTRAEVIRELNARNPPHAVQIGFEWGILTHTDVLDSA
jgi:DNA-binding NarL/FixJ family response regulator